MINTDQDLSLTSPKVYNCGPGTGPHKSV